VALFVARAREVKPKFALSDANAAAVAEVVRRLDGIPLALELAAARVRILSPQKILDRLRRRFDLLATKSRDLTPRQATLRGAIDWSWELLEPWEKAALAQASVFRGGFGLEAAEAVLDLSAWPDAPFPMDVVQALADKSVLRSFEPPETPDEVRFAVYESIREYAAEKLEAPGSIAGPDGEEVSGKPALTAAEERHAACYAELGDDAFVESLSGADGVAAMAGLALDLENLLVAVDRAILAKAPETAAGACVAAQQVLALRGPFAAAVRLAGRVLAAPDLPAALRPAILLAQAAAQRHMAQPQEAQAASQEALELARSQGDRRREGVALGTLGILAIEQGQVPEATARFEAALAIHQAEGHRRLEGIARRSLGSVDYLQGKMTAAGEHYESALAILRETGDRREIAKTLLNLGGWHGEQGRLDEANRCSEAALAAAREVGDRRSEGIILLNLGHHCQAKGLAAAAERLFQDALSLFRDIGDRISLADAHLSLGALHQDQGSGAADQYQAGLKIYRGAGNRPGEALALGRLGELDLSEGRTESARERLQAALVILQEVGDAFYGGVFLGALAELQATSDMTAARASLDQGEALLRDVGEQAALAIFLCRRGRIEMTDGNPEAAQAALTEAEGLAQALDASEDSSVARAVAALRQSLGA
jgi:predicted ATPase